MNVLMCEPTHYQVEYQINPWMKVGQVNQDLAMTQWHNLRQVYEDLGLGIRLIQQVEGWPDMVFAADQGLWNGREIILSNFRYEERAGESKYYAEWFEQNGFRTTHLPDEVYFEGNGECQWLGKKLLVGTGFRTTNDGVKALRSKMNVEVVELELTDERFYHLDTCLFPLNEKTIFYFPAAFSQASIQKIEDLGVEVVEMSEAEVRKFAANSVVVDDAVVMQKGNEWLAREVEARGYRPIAVDVSEFLKAGGGMHCLTFWLG